MKNLLNAAILLPTILVIISYMGLIGHFYTTRLLEKENNSVKFIPNNQVYHYISEDSKPHCVEVNHPHYPECSFHSFIPGSKD